VSSLGGLRRRDGGPLTPLAETIGIETLEAGPDEVIARLGWSDRLCTSGGALHGGALMALADNTGGVSASLNLPQEAAGTTTIESKTNFVRAVRSGHVVATSRPIHVGRTLVVVETELRDDRDRLVAKVTQSQLVLSGP
jgi:1,4-dihydroxy-2-naphthoyl-CoA hydrolase